MEVYDAEVTAGTAKIVSLSSRANVGQGDNALIIGFVVTGTSPKQVLIRGVGVELQKFGLTGTLADPLLELFQGNNKIAAQNDWSDGSTAQQVAVAAVATSAFPLTPGSKDAALIAYLAPGNYTAQVRGNDGGTGVGLVEVYEVSW
jgi:hypothetical protein